MDMLSARSADAAASDGQLLARIARGDKDAVTALYRRLERPLFAFLVKTLRDREAAADVLNETMLDVWRQAGRFEGKSSVATWIYSIAHTRRSAGFASDGKWNLTRKQSPRSLTTPRVPTARSLQKICRTPSRG
jgi:RNA polymerase sigma-70 factor (ECF subfamily)